MEIEQLLNNYRKLGVPYGQAKAKRTYLEEYKKSLLSLLMKAAAKEGHNSVSAQEREAAANQQYIDFLKALETAVEEEEKLRFEIKRTEMEIEVWRTEQANERMERKAYGA
jgi:hypothetical protein